MSQQSIGSNPTGLIGKLAGRIMNLIHNRQYQKIIRQIIHSESGPFNTVLDVGCGGGIAIKHFARSGVEKTYGIDISADMVNLATRVNQKEVLQGRVRVFSSDVEEIDLVDGSIDLVTIFDNINFWNDYPTALAELKRVLRSEGSLFIINAYPEEGTKWYEFVKFKGVEDYRKLLENNGFSYIMHHFEGHTIIIEARLSESYLNNVLNQLNPGERVV